MNFGRYVEQMAYCCKCGTKGVGNCSCWVKLRCPKCGRRATVERTADDGNAEEVEAECPLCVRRSKETAPKGPRSTGPEGK
jgi:hypothetical protein